MKLRFELALEKVGELSKTFLIYDINFVKIIDLPRDYTSYTDSLRNITYKSRISKKRMVCQEPRVSRY